MREMEEERPTLYVRFGYAGRLLPVRIPGTALATLSWVRLDDIVHEATGVRPCEDSYFFHSRLGMCNTLDCGLLDIVTLVARCPTLTLKHRTRVELLIPEEVVAHCGLQSNRVVLITRRKFVDVDEFEQFVRERVFSFSCGVTDDYDPTLHPNSAKAPFNMFTYEREGDVVRLKLKGRPAEFLIRSIDGREHRRVFRNFVGDSLYLRQSLCELVWGREADDMTTPCMGAVKITMLEEDVCVVEPNTEVVVVNQKLLPRSASPLATMVKYAKERSLLLPGAQTIEGCVFRLMYNRTPIEEVSEDYFAHHPRSTITAMRKPGIEVVHIEGVGSFGGAPEERMRPVGDITHFKHSVGSPVRPLVDVTFAELVQMGFGFRVEGAVLVCHTSLEVFVKMLTGKTLTLWPMSDIDVGEFMDMITEEEGIPRHQQRLIFGRRQLAVGQTLGDYGIKNNSTIHFVHRLGGGERKAGSCFVPRCIDCHREGTSLCHECLRAPRSLSFIPE